MSPDPRAGQDAEQAGRPLCVLTGASTGIGAALAREYAQQGWAVGLIARRLPLLEALAAEIRAAGGVAAAATADVTDAESVRRAIGEITAALGPCALLVANAGGNPGEMRTFGAGGEAGAGTLANMRLNFDGVIHSVAAVLPDMEARRSGVIAIVSSAAAFRGMSGDGGYSVSKLAVSAFGEMLRVEVADKGIGVVIIQPGFVQTPLTDRNRFPMPFMLSAPEAARRMRRAIERRARVYTFPWPMRLATWLGSLLPGWAWDRVSVRLLAQSREGKGAP